VAAGERAGGVAGFVRAKRRKLPRPQETASR
jgi:hypothetical protein